ncbi:MAG: hypothetical protein K0S28_1089 [Paucimonas sp.]|nr:hypothetical protein [Paucimonas sp.]
MASKTPFLPKIYVLIPGLAGSQTTLKEHIKRCADLAFDHVLLPAAGGPLTVLDEQTKLCADLCRKNRLALMLDLDIDKFAEDPETTDAHPDWFAAPDGGDDLPDPRRPPGKKTRALRYGNREVESSVISHVMQQLEKAVELGIVGFRCLGLPREASPLWAALIAQAKAKWPHARFLAWTPGCTAETLAALSQCGFDATFSSNAWWNYRADWLAEENSRLTAVAPPIALPDNPADSVLRRIEGYDDPQVRRNIFRRALRLSAAIGNGILLPMGFEHGFASESREVDPEEFRRFLSNAPFDLSEEVREANAFISKQGKTLYGAELRLLGGERGDAAVLLRAPADPGIRDNALVVAVNASLTAEAPIEGRQLLEHGDGYVPCEPVWNDGASDADSSALMTLRPGELQSFLASHLRPITLPPSRGKAAVTAAAKAPRIAIEAISPMVDAGRFSAKRTVGEVIDVEADVFMDGHDKLAVVLLWRAADEAEWSTTRMHALGNDRWTAPMPLTRVGRYLFAVEAWRDEFATYRDELQKKSDAGLDVSLELEEGRLKVESALAYAQENGLDEAASALKAFSKSLKAARSRDKAAEKNAERVALLLSEPMLEAMRLADARPFAVRSETLRVDADRASARFSSWYELFR